MSGSSRRSSTGRKDEVVVAAEGDSLAVSHPGKVLFPRDGITKRDVVHYYLNVAPVLLPHIRGRPLTFKPFPRGIDEKSYYLRSLPSDQPAWLRSVAYQPRTERTRISPVVATDVRTLVWAANRDAVEVHPWLCRADDLERPDRLMFDLDPGAEATSAELRQAAIRIRDRLRRDGLRSFVKTSGKRGLHVTVPLRRRAFFDEVRGYARAVAEDLASSYPDEVTAEIGKAQRQGRILVDYSQNSVGRSTASIYSLRPVNGAPVSTPLRWEEVETGQIEPGRFTWKTIFKRLDSVGGDLHTELLDLEQELPVSGT